MSKPETLRVYLEGQMLENARAGRFPFLAHLERAVTDKGWRVEWLAAGPDARAKAPTRDGYALFHMERPTHDRALTFRRAYYFPFWFIQPVAERWRFDVARADVEPTDAAAAAEFASRLRARVLPGPAPTREGFVLVPLQGHIRAQRSFQTMSPVAMLEKVAQTGRRVVATLHPKEVYEPADLRALDDLAASYPNLRIGGDSRTLLRRCDFVATMNSALAFDGYLQGKAAVLFAQIDFHHIALNVASVGADAALAAAPDHRPDFNGYVHWFLSGQAIQATAPDAHDRIRAAMRKGGWPI
ncbi:MAG: hypothetical protein DI498_02850 [Paracoccus denitrificans]|nr:MAG: hypothetical protein DI498_02850 [Paracoccus denitrificans]PZO85479.1 MAG: hypothetical protein DI633_02850 [Paracoccus denitrificans]